MPTHEFNTQGEITPVDARLKLAGILCNRTPVDAGTISNLAGKTGSLLNDPIPEFQNMTLLTLGSRFTGLQVFRALVKTPGILPNQPDGNGELPLLSALHEMATTQRQPVYDEVHDKALLLTRKGANIHAFGTDPFYGMPDERISPVKFAQQYRMGGKLVTEMEAAVISSKKQVFKLGGAALQQQ